MMELIADSLRPLNLKRLTIDVDGTVLSTGLQVERAFRGFNPHRRKVPSYYPITAYLAQTGHMLSVRNRSGNIHDGKASMHFFRDLFRDVRAVEPKAVLEVRLDGAFFAGKSSPGSRAEPSTRSACPSTSGSTSRASSRCACDGSPWGRTSMASTRRCTWLRGIAIKVAVYRKRIFHPSAKNFQLDLFDPSNGYWEYSAVTTNKKIGLRELWHFMAGRGTHEKVIGQLKSGFAFDAIPTMNYAANSTWQVLSVLAHNVVTSFQIATSAPRLKRSRKRTTLFFLKSIHTLRYEFINRAGIVQRPAGRSTLTLTNNDATRQVFTRLVDKLAQAA
jgi:hypothetical protein